MATATVRGVSAPRGLDRLGCYVLPGGVPDPRPGLQQAQVAEHLGFGTAWISERYDTKDLPALASAIGQVTSRIGIAAGITHPGLRHPMVLASMGQTLQALTDERFALGFGRSAPWRWQAVRRARADPRVAGRHRRHPAAALGGRDRRLRRAARDVPRLASRAACRRRGRRRCCSPRWVPTTLGPGRAHVRRRDPAPVPHDRRGGAVRRHRAGRRGRGRTGSRRPALLRDGRGRARPRSRGHRRPHDARSLGRARRAGHREQSRQHAAASSSARPRSGCCSTWPSTRRSTGSCTRPRTCGPNPARCSASPARRSCCAKPDPTGARPGVRAGSSVRADRVAPPPRRGSVHREWGARRRAGTRRARATNGTLPTSAPARRSSPASTGR